MNIEKLPEKLPPSAKSTNKLQATFGRYQIEKELGRGGMGVVYKAYDTKLKTTVALKIILNQEKKYIERFLLETSTIAKLNHPNIVRFYESGEVPKPHFIMEYIEGYTLSDLIKNKRVEPPYLVDIMIPLCEALHYAHKNKIMHRDIKPSNIMITSDSIPKIMDFGLAKITNATKQLSKSGQMIGTVSYMAPEQVEGKAIKESDIYSLGASIYEALTYRTVFQGQIEINIIVQIMNDVPIPLRQLNPDISPYLEAICLKCLNKNPKKRYSDFKQLAKELKNFKNNRPIIAKKYSQWDVLRNFIYKHKVICASVFLIFIILSIALLITLNSLNYAREQQNIATKEKKQANELAITVTKALEIAIDKDQSLLQNQEYLLLFKSILKQVEKSESKDKFQWIAGIVLGYMKNKDDQQKAIEYYNDIIKHSPKDNDAYLNRGSLYNLQGKYIEAEKDFTIAIALKPNARNYYARGKNREKQKKYIKAEKDYTKTISIDPKYIGAYYSRAQFYIRQKKYIKAEKDYTKIIFIHPNDADAYYNRGALYLKQNKYVEAEKDFTKAIAINPKQIMVYNNRGALYLKQNKYVEAEKDFTKIISINPKYTRAYNNRGTSYFKQKKYREAEKDYTKAISIDPSHAEAYYNRGKLYYERKKYIEAEKDFTKAISINPNHIKAYDSRGTLYSNQKRYDKAERDYTKIIAIDPGYENAYYNRGILYYKQKRYKEAEKDYTKTISIHPNKINAYSSRGKLYLNQKRYSEAEKDYTKTISIDPNYATAYHNRGYLYYKQKRYREAEKDYTRAIFIVPDYAHVYMNRGVLYYYQTKYQKALQDWEKAISLGFSKHQLQPYINQAKRLLNNSK